jgi:hypothetical protein
MEISNELIRLYRELIDQIYIYKDSYIEDELTLWPSGKGKDYKNELMIVGRSGNGGKIYIDKNENKYRDPAFVNVSEQLTIDLQWVSDLWGNNELNELYNSNYNTKTSAFWRLSKRLSEALTNNNHDFAINNIVYSNLYKVSKESGGNPSTGLMKIQFEKCSSILLEEINYYKPHIIVFLTGWTWAEYFLNDLKTTMNCEGLQYVECVGKMNDTLIVVSKHPQSKPEDEHYEEILTVIDKNK